MFKNADDAYYANLKWQQNFKNNYGQGRTPVDSLAFDSTMSPSAIWERMDAKGYDPALDDRAAEYANLPDEFRPAPSIPNYSKFFAPSQAPSQYPAPKAPLTSYMPQSANQQPAQPTGQQGYAQPFQGFADQFGETMKGFQNLFAAQPNQQTTPSYQPSNSQWGRQSQPMQSAMYSPDQSQSAWGQNNPFKIKGF